MRRPARRVIPGLVVVAAAAGGGRADISNPARAALDAGNAAVLAAIAVADEDRVGAVAALGAVRDAVAGAATGKAAPALTRVLRRLDAASVACADATASDAAAVRAARRAAVAARDAARSLVTAGDGVVVLERRGAGFHRPGATADFRVRGCAEQPDIVVAVAGEDELANPVELTPQIDSPSRFRVRFGPDLGGARVTVTACGETQDWYLFATGHRASLRVARPARPLLSTTAVSLRAGETATPIAPAPDSRVDRYEISPPLPAGLSFDSETGAISGTPTAASPTAEYLVVARNLRGAASTPLSLQVAPPLPQGVESLADGFAIAAVATGLDVPVKLAFTPDGRLFFTELGTGAVRVIHADGTLVTEPFATIPVLTGGERGLIGIALAPDFASSGHVYLFACTAADAKLPDRSRVLRLTASGDAGSGLTVVVDSLPVSSIHNGGDLRFGPDGKLYVTVGDTGDPLLSQTDGSLAGRVLRYEEDGSVPADNPIPGDPEWCRGLRNSFDLAFAPGIGSLFASENGPTAHDELNFIQKGKNYEWGAEAEAVPGPLIGRRMIDWTPVIVPTGITFLGAGAFGAEYATSLFVAGYDESDVRRVVLSGAQLADVDDELPFARFVNAGVGQKPLDLAEGTDGALYVSTFTAIWRISRY
jgi:glucose/arabinose dehydrogenase